MKQSDSCWHKFSNHRKAAVGCCQEVIEHLEQGSLSGVIIPGASTEAPLIGRWWSLGCWFQTATLYLLFFKSSVFFLLLFGRRSPLMPDPDWTRFEESKLPRRTKPPASFAPAAMAAANATKISWRLREWPQSLNEAFPVKNTLSQWMATVI